MGFLKKSNSSSKSADSDKSDGKKSWFSSRKSGVKTNGSKEEKEAPIAVPTRTSTDGANGTPIIPGPSSLTKHTQSFDQKVLQTEKNVRNEIQQASNRKDLRLQSTGGVLLFEGMTKEEFDEYSLKELRENDASIDQMNTKETDFVNVPGNYDPVKSGFYSKKTKNYYDSDEDEKLANPNQTSQGSSSSTAFCGCFENLTG